MQEVEQMLAGIGDVLLLDTSHLGPQSIAWEQIIRSCDCLRRQGNGCSSQEAEERNARVGANAGRGGNWRCAAAGTIPELFREEGHGNFPAWKREHCMGSAIGLNHIVACAGKATAAAARRQKKEMQEVEQILAEAGIGDVLLPDMSHLGPQSIARELDTDRTVADMLEAEEEGHGSNDTRDDFTTDNLAQVQHKCILNIVITAVIVFIIFTVVFM